MVNCAHSTKGKMASGSAISPGPHPKLCCAAGQREALKSSAPQYRSPNHASQLLPNTAMEESERFLPLEQETTSIHIDKMLTMSPYWASQNYITNLVINCHGYNIIVPWPCYITATTTVWMKPNSICDRSMGLSQTWSTLKRLVNIAMSVMGVNKTH